MEGEAWVGGSEGFGYTYRDRGVDSPVTMDVKIDREYLILGGFDFYRNQLFFLFVYSSFLR
jgi:hypothetical protein